MDFCRTRKLFGGDLKRYLISTVGKDVTWTRHNEEGVFRDYTSEANRLVESASNFFEEKILYGHDFILSDEFYPKYKKVLDKVSFGFAFKPMTIYDMLSKVEYGDVVFFVDSNHIVAQNPQPFFNMAIQNSVFVRDHIWTRYQNKEWTKRDTFVNMGCDEERYWNSLQMQCNVVGFCKNDFSIKFAKEWRDYSLNYDVMFGNNTYENFHPFNHHRHEQSIFSILVEKYKIPYLNRTENVWNEYIIPEVDYIRLDEPEDYSYRRIIDSLDNK